MFTVAVSLTIIFALLCQFIILKILLLFWPYHVPSSGSKTLLNMHGEIKSNKKRHCAHTHTWSVQRLSFEGENEKVESCFAPSGHKGLEHFGSGLTPLAYFGECFRGESNIRYSETFSHRPSFQPPLSHVLLHRAYSDWSLSAGLLHARAAPWDMRRKTLDSIAPFLCFLFCMK